MIVNKLTFAQIFFCMHDIEPWYGWRDYYTAESDKHSPFFNREYDEFMFSNKIYDHFIHPQWDYFGSETMYMKILFVDYDQSVALMEFIGEWNDCIGNDIMFLKRDIIDILIKKKVYKFVLFCDNVLNFHGDDDSYYEEWYDDIKDENGWICFVNTFSHVKDEMKKFRLQNYINLGKKLNDMNWRAKNPNYFMEEIENLLFSKTKLIQSF